MPRGGGGAGSSSGSKGAAPLGKQDAFQEAKTAMRAQVIGPFENHGQCKLSMVNVTATADMKCTIDLKTVVMRARNAEYNPKRFSACVSKTREMHRGLCFAGSFLARGRGWFDSSTIIATFPSFAVAVVALEAAVQT